MKNIRIVGGTYQVKFMMKDVSYGKSKNVSVGVYDSIKDAVEIRDFVLFMKLKKRTLIKKDVLKLVNEKREEMGYFPIRNSQSRINNPGNLC